MVYWFSGISAFTTLPFVMPRLNPDHRLCVHDLKVLQKISYMNIALRFSAQFPGVPAHSRRAIFKVRMKIVEQKVLLDRNNGNSGPRGNTRSDNNILRVYESPLNDPKLSLQINNKFSEWSVKFC